MAIKTSTLRRGQTQIELQDHELIRLLRGVFCLRDKNPDENTPAARRLSTKLSVLTDEIDVEEADS